MGFVFNSIRTIGRYTIINTDNDPTFFIRAWKFVAETSSGEVVLDDQTGVVLTV